jgi:hypothetical protein
VAAVSSLVDLEELHLWDTNSWTTAMQRYLHLAQLLHRHAGTLERHIIVVTLEHLNETLPNLPVCRVLQLKGGAVGAITLRVLSAVNMPVLEELHLQGRFVGDDEDDGEAAALELAWLPQLPAALRKVAIGTPRLWISGGEAELARQAGLGAGVLKGKALGNTRYGVFGAGGWTGQRTSECPCGWTVAV